jgi:hypothetical protein
MSDTRKKNLKVVIQRLSLKVIMYTRLFNIAPNLNKIELFIRINQLSLIN